MFLTQSPVAHSASVILAMGCNLFPSLTSSKRRFLRLCLRVGLRSVCYSRGVRLLRRCMGRMRGRGFRVSGLRLGRVLLGGLFVWRFCRTNGRVGGRRGFVCVGVCIRDRCMPYWLSWGMPWVCVHLVRPLVAWWVHPVPSQLSHTDAAARPPCPLGWWSSRWGIVPPPFRVCLPRSPDVSFIGRSPSAF